MIYVELLLSIITLIGIRLFGQGRRTGAVMCVLSNFGWLSMWVYTGQYGLIPVDLGLMFIYWERLYSQLKGYDAQSSESI